VKKGDAVRVEPDGDPAAADATVMLATQNQLSNCSPVVVVGSQGHVPWTGRDGHR
jgi:hypothetical protein